MIFRDLLVGVKQDSNNCELAFELLAELSRLSRMPTVTWDRYRIVPVLMTLWWVVCRYYFCLVLRQKFFYYQSLFG